MSQGTVVIFGIFILVAVFMLSRRVHAWRFKRAYFFIIEDLKARGALDPRSSVELPYDRRPLLRMGTRDFRPQALQHLISSNIVDVTDSGKYYLKDKTA